MGSLAAAHRLPIENLLSPDALRRVSWDPPRPCDEPTVAHALTGYGARPWQVELTAGPVAQALSEGEASAASEAEAAAADREVPGAGHD